MTRRGSSCAGFLALALAVLPVRVHAQFYEHEEQLPIAERYLSAGFFWQDFSPLGSNTSVAPMDYRIVAPVIGLHYETFDVGFSYGRYSTVGGTRSTVLLDLLYSMDLPLTGPGPSGLFLPLLIGADYTRSGSGGMESEFNVGSLGVGLGLRYRHRWSGSRVSVGGGAIAQYSFAGFRPVYGFSSAVVGDATLLVTRSPVFSGLAFGYRVRYQTWLMSDHALRYSCLVHGPFVGVLL